MDHEWASDAAERCTHCGTLRANTGQTVCPGPQSRDPASRPEPARRQYAIEAFDEIGLRTRELFAERTAAMNEPAKD
jgi:hypothetical protein